MGDFTIIRGDTCHITVVKIDENGEKINFIPGDKCTLSVKRNLKQASYDIQIESTNIQQGEIIITLPSQSTNIALSEYYYDIQYTDENNEIYTLSRGILTIDWDVTRND